MIFPGLDRSFRSIPTVLMCRHALEVNVMLRERFFEFRGTFVVKDVKKGLISIVLKLRHQCQPRLID